MSPQSEVWVVQIVRPRQRDMGGTGGEGQASRAENIRAAESWRRLQLQGSDIDGESRVQRMDVLIKSMGSAR